MVRQHFSPSCEVKILLWLILAGRVEEVQRLLLCSYRLPSTRVNVRAPYRFLASICARRLSLYYALETYLNYLKHNHYSLHLLLLHIKELHVGLSESLERRDDFPQVEQGLVLEDGVEDDLSHLNCIGFVWEVLRYKFLPLTLRFRVLLEYVEADVEGD